MRLACQSHQYFRDRDAHLYFKAHGSGRHYTVHDQFQTMEFQYYCGSPSRLEETVGRHLSRLFGGTVVSRYESRSPVFSPEIRPGPFDLDQTERCSFVLEKGAGDFLEKNKVKGWFSREVNTGR